MIPISIGPEPEVLAANRDAWGQEYKDALAAKIEPPERYRREDIRDALREETHCKCAYCESLIEHVSYVHIEHILPKKTFPELVCAWENLTLACPRCNGSKGTYYSAVAPLLNPYTDDVVAGITFFGPMAIQRTDQARLTISRIKLNRADLLFRRKDKLEEIEKLIALWIQAADNAPLREALTEDLNEKLGDAAEYTNCVRCFAGDLANDRGVNLPGVGENGA
jgi:uncharacterized protein (TIGR02646 family)